MKYSNQFISDELIKAFPDFQRFISEGASNLFQSRGFQMEMETNKDRANEVYKCINRFVLNKVDIADVKDPLAELGETYAEEFGFETQRLAVCQLPEMSPQARNIPRKGVNNQQIRDGILKERYITANDDFTNLITKRFFNMKEMFVGDYGVSTVWAGMLKQIQNSYVKHNYLYKKESIHRGLSSTKYPLKDTQKITLSSWTTSNGRMKPTAAEIAELIEETNLLHSEIETASSTDAFNAMDFDTAVDNERLVMVCRVGMKAAIKARLYGAPGIFNKDDLTIPYKIIETDNFGGMYKVYPVSDDFVGDGTEKTFELTSTYDGSPVVTVGDTATTAFTIADNAITFETAPANNAAIVVSYNAKLYPVYVGENDTDTTLAIGQVKGYALTEGATTVTVTLKDEDIIPVDPHKNVLAIIVDKGYVFRIVRNPLTVETEPVNHLGQYVNFSAVSMNNTAGTDPLYTVIEILTPEN